MVAASRAQGHSIPGLRIVRLPVRPAWLGVILVGGSVGTAARAWLEASFAPPPGNWPWVTFWINLAGTVLLGALLEILAETGPDQGWRRGLRLGVGTGLISGFTTYSTFSVEIVQLGQSGVWWLGATYGLASIVSGVLAAWLVMRLVRRLLRWRRKAAGR